MQFVLIFVILVVVILIFSIGVIFKRKPVSGSCGGLDAMGIEKACSCDKPCSEKILRDLEKEHTKK